MGAVNLPLSDEFVQTAVAEGERLRERMLDIQARGERWCSRGEELLRQAAELEAQVRELDELLGRAPQLRVDLQDQLLQGQALRKAAIRILAARRGIREPVHYREWYTMLHDLGYRAGGKDPLATFLTQINRASIVERVERGGIYQLNPQAAYDEARHSLRGASRRLIEAQSQVAGPNSHAPAAIAAAADEVHQARRRLDAVLRERQEVVEATVAGRS